MDAASISAVTTFEIYLLMTMKRRLTMAGKVDLIESKLTDHGLSIDDASGVSRHVSAALSDKSSRFTELRKLLGIADDDSASVGYSSVFWPGFDFNAIANESGGLESAAYRHTRRGLLRADSPGQLPIWSTDVTEFTERFGPMTHGHRWPLFDEVLPAYEEHEFTWNGERYGARFIWGLFLSSSKYWD